MRRGATSFLSALLALALLAAGTAPAHASGYFEELPDEALSWVPNGRVYDVAVAGDTVYIAGTFTRVRNPVTGQNVVRNRGAAFDRLTGELRPWDPNLDNRVRTLEVLGGTVYLGGTFLTVGGLPRERVVAVDSLTGAVDTGFVANATGEVRDLHAEAGSLWIAGVHGRVNGVARGGLTKVDAVTGEVDLAFNARVAYGRLYALHRGPADTLMIGGNFKKLQGIDHYYLGAVQMDTGARVDWLPDTICGTCVVIDIDVDGGTLGAAVGGGGGGRAAVWDVSDWSQPRWRWFKRGDGDVQVVSLHQGILYVGGHFGPVFNGVTEHQLVTLDTATGARTPYAVPFFGNDMPGLWALEATDDHLYIGGGFQGITGTETARYAVLPAAPPVPLG